jgi:TolA-binding protein
VNGRRLGFALALAGGLVGCRAADEQARAEGEDAEGTRLAALAAAFDADDCAEVERLAKGYAPSTPLRLAAVSTWLGRCLYRGDRFVDAEAVLRPVAEATRVDPHTRKALYYLGRAVYRQGRFAEAEATFVEFERRFPWDTTADDAAYHRAKARFRADDLEGARGLFEALLARADVSRFREAGGVFQLGRIEAASGLAATPGPDAAAISRAYAHFETVATDFADTGFHDDAVYRAARLHYDLAEYDAAEAALSDFEAKFPDSGWREGAHYYRARAVEAAGRADAALALYTAWAATFPEGRYRDNAAYRAGQVHYGLAEAATDAGVADAAYDAAAAAFEAFLRDWPNSVLKTSGAYFLGRARYERGAYGEARARFAEVVADVDSAYVDNALYYTGRAHYEEAGVAGQGALEAAVAAFDDLLARFPESSYADDAAYFRARALFRLMRNADADAAFAALSAEHPESTYADNAVYHRVLLAVARGDCDAAATHLDTLRRTHPDSEFLPDAERAVLACAPAGG